MKFIPVTINIESDVKAVYQEITSIQKNAAIMGGYLSDLYMRTPYKDIDIFIKHNELKTEQICERMLVLGYQKVKKEKSKLEKYGFSFYTYTYKKAGKTIQLIFTNQGIRHVKYFDIRLREFIYFNDQTYASKEALEDISKKQLVMGTSMDPMKAIVRAFHFSKRYGYSIEPQSLSAFYDIFNKKFYTPDRMLRIEEGESKERLKGMITQKGTYLHIETGNPNNLYGNTHAEHFAHATFEREIVEAIRNREFAPPEKETLRLASDDVEGIRTKKLKNVQREFRRKRLYLVTRDSDVLQNVENFCKNGEETELKKGTLDFLRNTNQCNELGDMLKMYTEGNRWIKHFQYNPMDVETMSFLRFFPFNQARSYAKGDLIGYKIDNKHYVLYNKKTKKVISQSFNADLDPWIEEIISLYVEKKAT